MTSNISSEVKTQYFVSTLSSVCFERNVCVKSTRSQMGSLLRTAQNDVNSKLFDVCFLLQNSNDFLLNGERRERNANLFHFIRIHIRNAT